MADNIKIDVRSFEKQLGRYVTRNALPGRIRKAVKASLPRIRAEFGKAFRRTIVAKGLLGKNPNVDFLDVQAQLGFIDDDGANEDLVNRIQEIFEQSFEEVESGDFTVRNLQLKFNINTANIEEAIRSQIDGSYTSESVLGTQATVEWLKALLDGWETPGYDILFTTESEQSRSGRAVMKKSTGATWDSDDYNRFAKSGNTNFVEDVIFDEIFAERVQQILLKEIKKVFE
jgi:hypothetical protein